MGRKPEFRSNYGAGPLVARIVERDGITYVMERWSERDGSKTATEFTLEARLVDSNMTGWRRIDKEGKSVQADAERR